MNPDEREKKKLQQQKQRENINSQLLYVTKAEEVD